MNRASSLLCPVIVGRDDTLELFDELIADAVRGRGRTLFLAGQAGVGKTRLIRAAARKAEAAGLRVDGGAVAPQDQEVPLASIRDLAFGMRGDDSFGTMPQDLLAIDGRHDGDSLGSRRLIVRAVADRILAEMTRPTMLVFADLHWTDEMSLEVIGELARHAGDLPILIIADYRIDELPPGAFHREWRARTLSQRHAQEIRLEPLTLEQTAMATTLILGSELPASRDVVAAVHQRTNGIPLHIEELLAALDDEARTDGRKIMDARVPDTIGDAVLARMSHLSEDAQLVARAGAVVGRCFSPDVIAGVVNRPLAELEPTLAELVDAAILRPFSYVDAGYYDFRHQLLRDALYGSVPPSELRRFHAQVAEFGMSLSGQSIIHASRHYERAGLRAEAFGASMIAAKEASRISARQEAYELYQRAIDNMPADLPIAEQAELYERYADAAAAIERNDECHAAATRARELYLEAGQPLGAAGALISLSILSARYGGPHKEADRFVEQALEEIAEVPPSEDRDKLRAYLLSVMADKRLLASDLDNARLIANEARELADAIGDRETVIETDLTLARIDIVGGRFETGLRDGMRAAREARDAGFEAVGVTGYRNLAILAARIMDAHAAESAIDEGLEYADAIEQSHCRQMMATTAAIVDWAGGRWDAADARARQELVDRGCRRGSIGSLDVVGLVALGRGHLDEAGRWLAESLAAGRLMDEVQFILTPLWGMAETELLKANPEAAIAHCEDAWSIASQHGERALLIPFVVTGTRSYLAARRPDDAERWLVRVREHLAGWEPIAGPALSHADGLVRLAAGTLTMARESLERGVRGWEDRRRVWEAAWARLDLVQCLMRMNRHADAAAVLAEVRAMAGSLRSDPILARVEELARAGRGRGLDDEPWRPLTVREFEVARLIAEGRTNAEIAARLDIAPKTASSHVEHILAKLGVTRRAEIAAWTATVSRGQPGPGASGSPGSESGPVVVSRR